MERRIVEATMDGHLQAVAARHFAQVTRQWTP
jgi:hypothetical protein